MKAGQSQAPQLLLHLEWWRGYYHFVRLHESLCVALAQPIGRGGRRRPQTLSAAHASDGCRTDRKALDGTRTTDGAAPTSTNRRWVKVGKRG
jgi:hypothetical protein